MAFQSIESELAQLSLSTSEQPLEERLAGLTLTTGEDNGINLSGLPSDVIRNIIRTGQESINDMMLISKRWEALAREHLSDRKRLPTIDFRLASIENRSVIFVRFPVRYREFFGVKENSEYATIENEHIEVVVQHESIGSQLKLSKNSARIVNRCSGFAKLELAGFELHECRYEMSIIEELMKDVKVEELVFKCLQSFNNDAQSTVLAVLRNYKIQRLVLSPSSLNSIIPDILHVGACVEFFAEASHLVDEVDLTAFEYISEDWDMDDIRNDWELIRAKLEGSEMRVGLILNHFDDVEVNVRIIAERNADPENSKCEENP